MMSALVQHAFLLGVTAGQKQSDERGKEEELLLLLMLMMLRPCLSEEWVAVVEWKRITFLNHLEMLPSFTVVGFDERGYLSCHGDGGQETPVHTYTPLLHTILPYTHLSSWVLFDSSIPNHMG